MLGSSQRDFWFNFLIDILRDAGKLPRHDSSAALLSLFATSECRDDLEALLLDRERDHWVRGSVLRCMFEKSLPLTGANARLMLAEFADALGSGVSEARTSHRQLADVATLVDLAVLSGEEEAAVALLGSLSGAVARDLLLSTNFSCPVAAMLREVAFRRALEGGCLDELLAWKTLSFAASRALLFQSPERLNRDKLERALSRKTPDEVDALFGDHPAALAMATELLALPIEYLMNRIPPDELRRSVLQRIDEANQRLLGGEQRVSYWSFVRCLAALPTGAQDLNRLRRQGGLEDSLGVACARSRLSLDPAPDFDDMPEAAIAASLRSVRPTAQTRPLLEWARSSHIPAFQYAGLVGLMELDGQPPRHVIDRFVRADEALIRLAALAALAAVGDTAAVNDLMHAAKSAPDVVLRARALRSLRASKSTPDGYRELCMSALKNDRETFNLYYAPATSEAALCLARSSRLTESEALTALVEADLNLTNDDAGWATVASIRSWVDGVDAEDHLNPVWYWMYLYPAHRPAC